MKNIILLLALMPITLAVVEANCTKTSEVKIVQTYTDPPLEKGVIHADATAAFIGKLKLEGNCIYLYSKNNKEKILPIFRNGSKLKGTEAVLIKQLNGSDLYAPMGELLVFGIGGIDKPKAIEKKNYKNCLEVVNKVVRLLSYDSTLKVPASMMK